MKFKQPILLRIPLLPPSKWVSQTDWDRFLRRYRHALKVLKFNRVSDRQNVDPETGEMWLHGKYSQDVQVTALNFSLEEVYYCPIPQLISIVMKKLVERQIVENSTLPEQSLA